MVYKFQITHYQFLKLHNRAEVFPAFCGLVECFGAGGYDEPCGCDGRVLKHVVACCNGRRICRFARYRLQFMIAFKGIPLYFGKS